MYFGECDSLNWFATQHTQANSSENICRIIEWNAVEMAMLAVRTQAHYQMGNDHVSLVLSVRSSHSLIFFKKKFYIHGVNFISRIKLNT